MKEFTKFVFIREILLQIEFAKKAASTLENPSAQSEPSEVWSSIQALLFSLANISKILWPIKPKSKKRGEILRKELDVDENNPIRNRFIRDQFEHYDERIEEWAETSGSSVYMDLHIDPLEPVWKHNYGNVHRKYDPIKKEIFFRTKSINLPIVFNALDNLIGKIKEKGYG